MTIRPIAAAVVALCLGACGGRDERPARAVAPADWRGVATAADRERLRNWRDAWMTALAKVQAAGRTPALAPLGALFEPDRALTAALPPSGDYRCRVFKLGARHPGLPELSVHPYFECRIDDEGEVRSLYKLSGSQRPVGLLFRDGDTRGIFLGTLMLGDETSAMQYGQDATRDMAGIVERIGDRRWWLVLPYPAFESTLDVIELIPAR